MIRHSKNGGSRFDRIVGEEFGRSRRRGASILAFVAAMLVIGTMALWMTSMTSAANTASMGHYYSQAAFYGAESGVEMALMELNGSPASDIDSDGLIGTISNNSVDADDPTLVGCAFRVEQALASPLTLKAVGRPTQGYGPVTTFRRVIEVVAE